MLSSVVAAPRSGAEAPMYDGYIKIMIADDHAMQRDAMKKLLEKEKNFQVVGMARDTREILDQLPKLNPDVLLLDLNMRRESGLEVMRNLNGSIHDLRVLLLTSAITNSEVIEALRLGVCGVILKNAASQLLFKGIRAVMAGQYWIDRESVAGLVRALQAPAAQERSSETPNSFGLTEREIEILSAIVDGYANKDIAQKLCISEQTVKHHLTRIFGKVGVTNRLELALFAMNNRLAPE